MGEHSDAPSQTHTKSAKIYTPKRYDEHPRHFFIGVPLGPPGVPGQEPVRNTDCYVILFAKWLRV